MTAANLVEQLSGREIQGLRLIALGYSNKGVAEQMGINRTTVYNMAGRIYQKLGISTGLGRVQDKIDVRVTAGNAYRRWIKEEGERLGII